MKKIGIAAALVVAAAVAAAADQPAAAPAAPKMDPEACMKHCKEMGEARAKMAAKHDAAWKQIEADLATAKKATGEKKVAALESVVEKLVAFHAEMSQAGTAHAAMASMDGHDMDGCAGKGGAAMASMSGKAMDCCAGEGHAAAGMAGCDHEAPAAAAAPAKK
jgi:hypothetical protein